MGVGFPLVMVGVITLLIAGGSSTAITICGAAMTLVGAVLFFHPR
jgi:hypothetical protein